MFMMSFTAVASWLKAKYPATATVIDAVTPYVTEKNAETVFNAVLTVVHDLQNGQDIVTALEDALKQFVPASASA